MKLARGAIWQSFLRYISSSTRGIRSLSIAAIITRSPVSHSIAYTLPTMASQTFIILLSLLSLLIADVLAVPKVLPNRSLSKYLFMNTWISSWSKRLISLQAPPHALKSRR
jgi:hypothetical protein